MHISDSNSLATAGYDTDTRPVTGCNSMARVGKRLVGTRCILARGCGVSQAFITRVLPWLTAHNASSTNRVRTLLCSSGRSPDLAADPALRKAAHPHDGRGDGALRQRVVVQDGCVRLAWQPQAGGAGGRDQRQPRDVFEQPRRLHEGVRGSRCINAACTVKGQNADARGTRPHACPSAASGVTWGSEFDRASSAVGSM